MGKKVYYTQITPLPPGVPRQLALDLLHSHDELIKLNPLVTHVTSIEPPRDAVADEYYANWYEISEILTWAPGMKKKMSFKGVFHDQPWGLQSHTYAPLNTDMRQKYRIGGNQPGEPPEIRELGLDTPREGLYLREDHEIVCAIPLTAGFVKKEMKAATAVMVERLTRKAELLEEGKLHAMFEAGKLKTSKPSQAPTFDNLSPPGSPMPGATFPHGGSATTGMKSPGFARYSEVARNESIRKSQYSMYDQQTGYGNYGDVKNVPEMQVGDQGGFISELPGSTYHPGLTPSPLKSQTVFRSELPGDSTFVNEKPDPPAGPHPAHRPVSQSNTNAPNQPKSSLDALPSQQRSSVPSQNDPQPRPPTNLSDRPMSYASSRYSVTNPDTPTTQYGSSATSIQQWQQNAQNDAPIDDNYYRNSRHSHGSTGYEPDHQQFSKLSVSNSSDAVPPALQPGIVRCPVCKTFEGDETAVSHHYSSTHIS